MTRKTLALLLSFVLLATQTSLAVRVHYCGGEAVSVAAGFHLTGGGCGMEPDTASGCATGSTLEKKGCCDETSVQLKVKQDAPTIAKSGFGVDAILTTPTQPPLRFQHPVPSTVYRIPAFRCEAHGPPLFILYSSYLVYA
ncbi:MULTISPECIES: hypothetical protein [unclassified Flavobacterium]|uniref:HYC_CC_PP family protein n=1 Tax=unclassified Flavobacterium TaxID=196869 RepID=UPI001F147920|nr:MULTISPECIES: hypothetical protein [unclassified Flavobacterium]UMY66832.1 hypothetical protein MKO97_05475 [Flavobacterium sp. HJ-32-4]